MCGNKSVMAVAAVALASLSLCQASKPSQVNISTTALDRPQISSSRFNGNTLSPKSDLLMAPKTFRKDFTQPMSIPEEGIEAAIEVFRSGRLFRYCTTSAETSQVALAEKEFAAMAGAIFAIGVNSCSSAILIALVSIGIQPKDKVLTNAFTFTAVTSAILRIGGEPVLVECGDRCCM